MLAKGLFIKEARWDMVERREDMGKEEEEKKRKKKKAKRRKVVPMLAS